METTGDERIFISGAATRRHNSMETTGDECIFIGEAGCYKERGPLFHGTDRTGPNPHTILWNGPDHG